MIRINTILCTCIRDVLCRLFIQRCCLEQLVINKFQFFVPLIAYFVHLHNVEHSAVVNRKHLQRIICWTFRTLFVSTIVWGSSCERQSNCCRVVVEPCSGQFILLLEDVLTLQVFYLYALIHEDAVFLQSCESQRKFSVRLSWSYSSLQCYVLKLVVVVRPVLSAYAYVLLSCFRICSLPHIILWRHSQDVLPVGSL